MKIVFFGSGSEMSMLPLEAVSKSHDVLAVITPQTRSLRSFVHRCIGWAVPTAHDPMARWSREHKVNLLNATSGRDSRIAEQFRQLRPDIICVSAFPWMIGKEILGTARLGGVNVHPSLLPRHRGPVPLFWTYHSGDRQAGVTVHVMTERADAGDILAQQSSDLPRGFPAIRLHALHAKQGADLLIGVLQALERGEIERIKQNDELATYAPHVPRNQPMAKFQEWDVERVWHFLAGLCPRYREPLRDANDKAVVYQSVLGYEQNDHGHAAGTLHRASHGWNLYCRSGFIRLGDQPAAGSQE